MLHLKTFVTIQVFSDNQFCLIIVITRIPMYNGVYVQKGCVVNDLIDIWH